jgi:SAM-dependent methyltransferase
LPQPRAALAEIARVLRPGGTLSVSWVRSDGLPPHRAVLAVGRRRGLTGPSLTPAEVRDWLDDLGFTGIQITTSGAFAYAAATRLQP